MEAEFTMAEEPPAHIIGLTATTFAAVARPIPEARLKPYRGPPMTLGTAAAAHVQFMVWCKACGYRSEPDPGEQARVAVSDPSRIAGRLCSTTAQPGFDSRPAISRA